MCDVRMMEVDVGRHSVLLTRCDGKYSAISNQCSHYGAPLSKGKEENNKKAETIKSPVKMLLSSVFNLSCCRVFCRFCSGVISGHKVRCPWHGSCFNALTGDLEEFPGIDSLPCHKVPTGRYIHI